MRKKLLLILLAVISTVCMAFGLTACDEFLSAFTSTSQSGSTSDSTSGDDTSGDDTSGDDTSGDDTSGDDTSGDDAPKTPTEGLAYKLSNDQTYYTVTGIGTATDTDIVIPSTYNDKPVTSIGEYAFYDCSSLTSITIPDSVTSIGWGAFSGCSSLTSINIPEGVTSIGEEAFKYCDNLTSITIPASVTSIGEYAFEDCTGLTEINFNATAMDDLSYKNYVFSRAGQSGSGITVNIGANVTKIPAYLFYPYFSYSSSYTPKITSVVFAENSVCQSIGYQAFYSCSSLTSINIPEGVTSIGERAFYSCSSLTSINIPEGVTSIGEGAFYSCSSLTSINIPNSVTSIDWYAFSGCSSLQTVTFGDNSQLTSIGNGAFYNCNSLTRFAPYPQSF